MWLTHTRYATRPDAPNLVVTVPLYFDGRLLWLLDDSPTYLSPCLLPIARYAVSHATIPGHRRWLCASPTSHLVTLHACFWPSCGRPRLPNLCAIFHLGPLVLPSCAYPVLTLGHSHLTACLAARSYVILPSLPALKGILAAAVRLGTLCFRPNPTLLLPTPPWASSINAATLSPLHLCCDLSLIFVSWNVGGVDDLVEYIVHMLLALEVDFFSLKELWDSATLVEALTVSFVFLTSTANGCSTRFMVGWCQSLQHPSTRPRVEHDAADLLVATARHHTVGFILVATPTSTTKSVVPWSSTLPPSPPTTGPPSSWSEVTSICPA